MAFHRPKAYAVLKAAPGLCAIVWLCSLEITLADDFRILDLHLESNGERRILAEADTNHYYVLKSSSNLTAFAFSADIRFGDYPTVALSDAQDIPAIQFYRVLRVPLNAPLDTDGDGFDDVLELLSPHVTPLVFDTDTDGDGLPDAFEEDWGLSTTNPADGNADYDQDGLSNLAEFHGLGDPFQASFAATQRLSVSEVFVGSAQEIQGGTTDQPSATLFSMPMLAQPLYAGKVSSTTGNELVMAANSLPQELAVRTPSYVHFESGLIADISAVDESKHSISLARDIDALVQPGEFLVVRQHATVEDILGTTESSPLMAEASMETADQVVLLDAPAQQELALFLYSGQGASFWSDREGAEVGRLCVGPAQGIEVLRKQTNSAIVYMNGVVRAGPLAVQVYEGENRLGTVTIPEAVTLDVAPSKLRE
ncbi:MAG: hypothetical protein JW741_13300 [Sedimentisphaerales bacterium]|nr:hypothetical protein [Sedimentisphaerales bacterium]